MNAYIKFIKICTLAIAVVTVSVNAYSASFVSPVPGSVIRGGTPLELRFDSPENTDSVLIVNGVKTDYVKSGEDKTFVIEKGLDTGVHNLQLVSYGDGISETDEIVLYAEQHIENTEVNEKFTDGKHSLIASGAGVVGKKEDGREIKISKASFEGIDGDENGASGFLMSESYDTKTMSNSSGQFIMYYPNPDKWGSGIVTIDYDLMLFSKCAFEIETKSGSGHSTLGGSRFLKANGTILSTGIEYPIGEWMHIKQIMDYDNSKQYMYINGEAIIDGTALSTALYKLTQLKFQYYITENTAPQGMALDNVVIRHTNIYPAFSELMYETDDGWINAESNTIKEKCNKIKLNNSKPVFISMSTVDAKATYDGVELKIKSASIDEEGAFIAEFENPLPAQGDIELAISPADASKKAQYYYRIHTDIPKVTFNSVSVSNGDVRYYINDQLKAGDLLTASFDIKNETDIAVTVYEAVAVYDGKKLESITFDQTEVAAFSSKTDAFDFKISEESKLPDVEIYLFDSFVNTNALSKVWKLK